ncbi:unnamed protein product [Schistosoma margrebowiei]|uniref:Uncharacterized protein n=1 Tax=Schistosoma margrebowiei TaxID=48269 RepID=A0AA84ZGK0_9TREM|nr:unnamed protein product [Schistosoma margrebowiei]
MNIYIIGILCTIGLIISQGFTATTNLPEDQLDELNIINKYLKLKGINKQITEDDLQKLLNNNEIDKHLVKKINNTHPIETYTQKHDEPIIPLWIINPPYYLVEKLFQLLGYLIRYDDGLEIYRP